MGSGVFLSKLLFGDKELILLLVLAAVNVVVPTPFVDKDNFDVPPLDEFGVPELFVFILRF